MEKPQEAPGFGAAQKQKLTDLLDKIREFHFSVSIDDLDNQYVFSLTVRDLVLQLQALAAPILPATIAIRLESIDVDVQDFDSATSARAELDALVPAVEDALQTIDRRPGTLLSGFLRQLLEERNLDPVSEEIQRALDAAESDPPVAITAARAALESLLKVYIEDKELTEPKRPRTDNLLKIAMSDLGLVPADKVDRDVRRVLQSLWSIVHGVASLRTLGGSAHGHGRRSYRLQARHARLAVQSALVFIKFFVETWIYHERRRSSG